jgi:hypothetical protein
MLPCDFGSWHVIRAMAMRAQSKAPEELHVLCPGHPISLRRGLKGLKRLHLGVLAGTLTKPHTEEGSQMR